MWPESTAFCNIPEGLREYHEEGRYMIRIQQLKLPLDYTMDLLRRAAAKRLRVPEDQIGECELVKRSVDARKKPDIQYVAVVDVSLKQPEAPVVKKVKRPDVILTKKTMYELPESGSDDLKSRPVIVGAGPAGLFCALMLAKAGYAPMLLERGDAVEKRTADVERFWSTGNLNPSSNIQFGEGGAGTFSDGKLNTLVKDPAGRNRLVLEIFARAGADSQILYVNKPHIGTDVLREVVKTLREEIIRLGGEVRFLSQVTDLETENGVLKEIVINHTERLSCQVLVIAIGHSARDTFAMLKKRGILMQPKAFAVGVRIEHPQSMINQAQYGCSHHPLLSAADYKVTRKLADGRGGYSFCMCPGGYVVNASSEEGRLAVNGMSYHARDGRNANSALIVTVTPEDFGHEGVLGGIEFQRDLERAAYQAGRGKVPVQLFEDFRKRKNSLAPGEFEPCILGGYEMANVREILPAFIGRSLEEAILAFENQIPGFSRPDALLSGVESRTSSPVRIVRDASYLSNISGLYPCGEGAGYAGGITSAAMDGIRVAEAIIKKYRKF